MSWVQTDAQIIASTQQNPYQRVRLYVPTLAIRMKPGQFITADLGEPLRQPLWPAALGSETLDLLLPTDHPAINLVPNHKVNLLGPLGQPLHLPAPPTRLLIVADHPHLPALLPAVHQALDSGCPVTLLLWAPTAADLYPPTQLPPALEIHLVTGDGSAGQKGALSDLADQQSGAAQTLWTWADQVLVATDPSLYPILSESIRTMRLETSTHFAQALLFPTIVCGVGACQGCAVSTQKGYRQACTDGPAFDLLTLEYG